MFFITQVWQVNHLKCSLEDNKSKEQTARVSGLMPPPSENMQNGILFTFISFLKATIEYSSYEF